MNQMLLLKVALGQTLLEFSSAIWGMTAVIGGKLGLRILIITIYSSLTLIKKRIVLTEFTVM